MWCHNANLYYLVIVRSWSPLFVSLFECVCLNVCLCAQDMQRRLVDPSDLPLVEELTNELQALRESRAQQDSTSTDYQVLLMWASRDVPVAIVSLQRTAFSLASKFWVHQQRNLWLSVVCSTHWNVPFLSVVDDGIFQQRLLEQLVLEYSSLNAALRTEIKLYHSLTQIHTQAQG